MAEVYRAEQALTSGISRPVAVKVIRPEYSESPDFRQMFLDEARTACTLAHPNIAHIYEVGETDDGLLYMAMELVPGETLATINRTMRDHAERFSDEALFAIGIWTAGALEAVHALRVEDGTVNLVHRDVSPHNLLLSSSGSLKLIDFGIAKAATNRNLTMPGVTKGKAGYFSPEQAMGKKLDGRSDLFSLGVTLYKLASGSTPFDDFKTHADRHAALVRGQWQRLEAVYPGMPPGFYEVVDKALQVKPEDRYQTAREMREALEKGAFEAGLRVGQSSLLGYVDSEGEITAAGGSRSPSAVTLDKIGSSPSLARATSATGSMRRAASASQPALAPEHHTEKVQKPPQRGLPVKLLAAAFVSAVIIGVMGVVLLTGPTKKTVVTEPRPEVVKPPDPPVKPKPVVVAQPPVVVVVDAGAPEVVAVVEPERVVKPAQPKPKPKPPRPEVVAKVPEKAKPEKPEKPPEEAAPAAIPAGQGKLRIGATDTDAIAGIFVGAEDWGTPPVDRRVSSGQYVVTVKLSNGQRSTAWKGPVYPDKTTVLMYDVANSRWSAK